jgi:acyl-[acyl-carrier-protein] desaturase
MNEHLHLPEIDKERDDALFHELAKPAERLMDRHMDTTNPWSPHNYVPYDMGRTYSADQPWTEADRFLPPYIESALVVNTLTEDNLPEYFSLIASHAARDNVSGNNHPFVAWSKQWKTEEARHGLVMDEWLHVTRAVDPEAMQRDREVFLSQGETPQPATIAELLAYTALQELATRVSHLNTGKAIQSDIGETYKDMPHMGREMLGIVAADESRHHRFYAGLAAEAMAKDPSTMTIALGRQVVPFAMPGIGIPGFTRHAARIDRSGIYGEKEYRHSVLQPTMERIGFDDVRIERLSPEAQLARTAIMNEVERIDNRLAKRNRIRLLGT